MLYTLKIRAASSKFDSSQSRYWHCCTCIYRKDPFFTSLSDMHGCFFVMFVKMRSRFLSMSFPPRPSSPEKQLSPACPFRWSISRIAAFTSTLSNSISSSEAADKDPQLYSLVVSFLGDGDSEFVIVDCCINRQGSFEAQLSSQELLSSISF